MPPARKILTGAGGAIATIGTLAMGALFIGTGEFVSMSLLPDLAASTGVNVQSRMDTDGPRPEGSDAGWHYWV
jgi:hypothetical protein